MKPSSIGGPAPVHNPSRGSKQAPATTTRDTHRDNTRRAQYSFVYSAPVPPVPARQVDAGPGPVNGSRLATARDDATAPRHQPPAWFTRIPRWVPVAVLTALVMLPLVVAVVALRRPRWLPVLDLAMTELRVRDVGTGDTPLIGLPGRIGTLAEQGSHPGPMSFYVLAPVYRLLGSSAWALQVGTVVAHTLATAGAVWIARRRGGLGLAVAISVALALLVRAYGLSTLTQPWNPYLPLVAWLVVLLATWSILCGDLAMLPVAVVAGSFCAQTHVPYVGLVGGLAAVIAVALFLDWRRASPSDRRRLLRWVALSAVIGAVLWAPVVVDQATRDPGNLSLLADHLLTPPEEDPVGLGTGLEELLRRLNVLELVSAREGATGALTEATRPAPETIVPGAVVLAVWLAAAVAAWRLRHRSLIRLHAVVAAGLAFGLVSISRIFGKTWYYLMLWAWAVTALAVIATVWTGVEFARRHFDDWAGPGRQPRDTRWRQLLIG
jgi:hypothetical protein